MASAPDLRHELDALLKQWSAAIVANDQEAIGRFMTDDWILIASQGVFTREQFLGSVANGVLTHDMMRHDVPYIRRHGDVAVVVTRGRTRA